VGNFEWFLLLFEVIQKVSVVIQTDRRLHKSFLWELGFIQFSSPPMQWVEFARYGEEISHSNVSLSDIHAVAGYVFGSTRQSIMFVISIRGDA
jgi:hypothetical protein